MRILTILSGAAALLFAAPVAAQEASAPSAAPDYSNPAAWLCRPGREDSCAKPLPTTALNPNGYGSVGRVVPAADAPVDCFYVYPTVSRDPGDNSDLVPGIEEQGVATVQFARFSGLCRTYAPLYRQGTLAALAKAMSGTADIRTSFAIAYGDVVAAWRHYLEHDNQGRPFVLIGHSQGSVMLEMLLAREIEGRPEAARMLSAMLIGYNVEVPEGKLVGGTFKKTPLCSRVGETGCVVTYVSFRAGSPPPPGALFGRAVTPGMTVGCTNPARFAQGPAPLDSYWYAGPSILTGQSPIAWSTGGAPPTPFLRTEGLASGTCVHDGPIGYFAISVNADPSDARTDAIPGDVVLGGAIQPGWGMHLADMNLGMGDMMALIAEQTQAWRSRARRR
jgi:hypothetical protein